MDKKRVIDIAFEVKDIQTLVLLDVKRHLKEAEGMTEEEILNRADPLDIRWTCDRSGDVTCVVGVTIYDTTQDHVEALEQEMADKLKVLSDIHVRVSKIE